MQPEIIETARGNIKKFNDPSYALFKGLLKFLIIYIAAFLAGIFCYYFFDFPFTDKINGYILGHFSNLFSACEAPVDYIKTVLGCSATDIQHTLLIFTAGFTMFCGAAITAVTVYRGISLGFSAGYLALAINSGEIALGHPRLAFITFLAANVLIASTMLYMCAKSVVFSYEFRLNCVKRSAVFRSPILYRHLFSFLTMFGFILIVNLIRCLLGGLFGA